jgi:hypothetical protein
MRKRTRLLFAAVATTLVLGVLAGSASATRLGLNVSTFSATWSTMSLSGAFSEVLCPVTLEGTFHRMTLAKVADSLVGVVTRARIEEASCTARAPGVTGRAILLSSLPWHITYRSFTGTLPRIESVKLAVINLMVLVSTQNSRESISCLFVATSARPLVLKANLNLTTGVLENLQVEEANRILLSNFQPERCPQEGLLGGTTNFVGPLPGSRTSITITLVA